MMQSVKARVKNGRLVLDEPTDRPEGEEVELVPLDEVLADEDGLDDEDRTALRAELVACAREMKAGAELVEADVVLAELRAMK